MKCLPMAVIRIKIVMATAYRQPFRLWEQWTSGTALRGGCRYRAGGENRAVPYALKRMVRRRIQQPPRLRIAEGRVLPSLLLVAERLTPSTGLPMTALRSHK